MPHEYTNPSYPGPGAPPPYEKPETTYSPYQPNDGEFPNNNDANQNRPLGGNYGQPATAVVVMPPASTGAGLFLNDDVPIVVQPGAAAAGPAGALEYLKNVSSLLVKQKIEMIEIFTNFDTQNRFTMYDEAGRPVFYALEDSNFCVRQCCGPARPFEMSILDVFQNEVIHITRPLACQCWCCFCCLMHVEVFSMGQMVGRVQQQFSIIKSEFTVENAVGEVTLRIEGPCWKCTCGGDIVFKILSADGQSQLGSISKKWSGFIQEFFTDADDFKINFPDNLDVAVKSTLLGALFLIDVMYFEKKKK